MPLYEIIARGKARVLLAEHLEKQGVRSEFLDPNNLEDDMFFEHGWHAFECRELARKKGWRLRADVPSGFPFGRTVGVFLDAYELPL